jgi:hypothetical protein
MTMSVCVVLLHIVMLVVTSRALCFSERASICSRKTSETSSRKTVRVSFYLRPCYLFALTSFSIPDWKLLVKLKGLLNISGP